MSEVKKWFINNSAKLGLLYVILLLPLAFYVNKNIRIVSNFTDIGNFLVIFIFLSFGIIFFLILYIEKEMN